MSQWGLTSLVILVFSVGCGGKAGTAGKASISAGVESGKKAENIAVIGAGQGETTQVSHDLAKVQVPANAFKGDTRIVIAEPKVDSDIIVTDEIRGSASVSAFDASGHDLIAKDSINKPLTIDLAINPVVKNNDELDGLKVFAVDHETGEVVEAQKITEDMLINKDGQQFVRFETMVTNADFHVAKINVLNASFEINQGKVYVNNALIQVDLLIPDNVFQYRVSDGDCSFVDWKKYEGKTFGYQMSNDEGGHNICVQVRDHALEESAIETKEIVLDLTPPTLSHNLLEALGPSFTPGSLTLIEGTAEDNLSGVEEVKFSIKNKESLLCFNSGKTAFDGECPVWHKANGTVAWQFQFPDLAFSDGDYALDFNVKDRAGNELFSNTSHDFVWDSQSPSGEFLNNNGGYITPNPILNVNFASNGDISEYRMVEAGDCTALDWTDFDSNNFNFNLSAGDGDKSLCAQTRDKVGNKSTVFTVTVTLDRDLPTSTISTSSIVYPTTDPGSETYVVGTSADGLSGVATVFVSIQENAANCLNNDATAFDAACPNFITAQGTENWAVTINDNVFSDGATYSILANAIDFASNAQAAVTTGSFVFDLTPVDVVITNPTMSAKVNLNNESTFAVSGTCSESGENVVISGDASANVACSGGNWATVINLSGLADGPITLYADHSDAFGSSAIQDVVTLSKDTIAPTFAVNAPGLSDYIHLGNVTSFAFSGSCSDNNQNVIISGAVTASAQCSGGTWSHVTNASALPEGIVNIDVDFEDDHQNAATTVSLTLTKDTIAPVVTVESSVMTNAAYFIDATTSDANAMTYLWSQETGPGTISFSGTNAEDVTLSADTDGSYSIKLSVTDVAGNKTVKTVNFVWDTTVPTLAFTSPTNSSYINATNSGSVSVGGTCSEASVSVQLGGSVSATPLCLGGVFSADLDLSGESDGALIITADIQDAAGNNAVQQTLTINKDATVPTVAISSPANNTYVNASSANSVVVSGTCSENTRNVTLSGSVTGSDTCTGNAWSVTLDLSAAADGNFIINANHNDLAGNNAVMGTTTVIKDTSAPTLSMTTPQLGDYINVANESAITLSGACSEQGRDVVISGSVAATVTCSSGAWSTTLDYSGVSDGPVTIDVNHDDPAGNVAATVSLTLTKDTTVPSVSIATADGDFCNISNCSTFNLTGTCSENGGTVAIGGSISTTASCSSGSWSKVVDYTGIADGLLTVTANISDAAGNTATQDSINLVKDTIAPAVNVGSDIIANSTYSINASATDNNTMTFLWTKESGAGNISFGNNTLVDTTVLADANATYVLRLTVSDEAGNSAFDELNFQWDSTAPSVVITAPNPGDFFNASTITAVTVSGTCSENGFDVTITGNKSVTTSCSSGTFSTVINYSDQADGVINIYADHQDSASNAAPQANLSINKDTVAPIVNVGGDFNSVNPIFIDAAASDANTLTYAWTHEAGGGTITFGTAAAEDTTATASSDGIYTLRLTVADPAGNSAQDDLIYTVDTALPTVTIDSPTNGSYINAAQQSSFTVSGTCSENSRTVAISGHKNAVATCTGGAWSVDIDYSQQAEGNISIQANHDDEAGNMATPASVTVEKDTIIPIVNVGADLWRNAVVTVNAVTSDLNTMTYAWSQQNGPGTVTFSAATAEDSDVSADTDGVYMVRLTVTDAAGNANYDEFQLTWDTAGPGLTIDTPLTTDYIGLSSYTAVTVSGTCSENGRDVVISGSKSATMACSSGTWSQTFDFTSVSDGALTITATHDDLASNVTQVTHNPIKDIVPPVVNAGANVLINSTFSQDATATDANPMTYSWTQTSGPGTITFAPNNAEDTDISSDTDGDFVLRLTVTDAAGNSNFDEMNFTWDTVAPVIDPIADVWTSTPYFFDANVTDLHSLTYVWSQEAGSGTLTFGNGTSQDTNVSADTDDTYTVRLTATDGAGNASTEDVSFVWDTTPPSVTIDTPVAYMNAAEISSVTVSGTCTEEGLDVDISGNITTTATCSSGTWSIDIDYSGEAEGNISIVADHYDLSNNSDTDSIVVVKDTVFPAVNVGSDIITNGLVNIDATTSDLNGIQSWAWSKIVGSGILTFATGSAEDTDISADTDDLYTVRLTVTDNAGNVAYDSLQFEWDTLIPTVTIDTPAVSSYCNASDCNAFTVSGTCSEDGRTVTIGGSIADTAVCSSGTWSTIIDYSGEAEGLLNITADLDDDAGNNAVQATRSFTKDTVLPSVNVGGDVIVNALHSIDATTSDINGIASYTWSKPVGTGNISFSSASAEDTNVSADNEEVYTLRLTVIDSAGNSAFDELDFEWDVTIPTVSIAAPINATYCNATNCNAIVVSGNCSEDGRQVTVGGSLSDTATCNTGSWTTTIDYSGEADGLMNITANHDDAATNSAVQASVQITKDTVAPSISAGADAVVNATHSQDATVTDANGIASYTWSQQVGSGTLTFGTGSAEDTTISADTDDIYTIRLTAVDNAGNSAFDDMSFEWDTTVPTVSITTPIGGSYCNASTCATYTVAGSCSENGRTVIIGGSVSSSATCLNGSFTKQVNYAGQAEGALTVTADLDDDAGNNATQASVGFNKDVTFPIVNVGGDVLTKALYSIDATTSDTNALTYAWTKQSGTGTLTWSAQTAEDSDVSSDTDGIFTLRLTATDVAGNTTYDELNFEWDTTPPTVSITSHVNGNYCNAGNCNAVTIGGACSENGQTINIGGAQTTTATCSSGSWTKIMDYSGEAEGNISITADLDDLAGNSAPQASVTIIKDTVLPAVNVGADVLTNAQVTIDATTSDTNGIATYGWTKQSGAGTIAFGSGTAEDTTAQADSDSVYVLRLTVTDNAGNVNFDELQFTWDVSDPTVTITTPAGGSYCNASNCASFTVAGNCSENGRTVTIGGSVAGSATCSSGSYSTNINYSGEAEGALTITADLDDAAGNNATQASVGITKDTTLPAVNVGGDLISNASTSVDATTSDANGITTYTWSQQSGPGTISFSSSATEDTNISANTEGTYVVRLTVVDSAGNSNNDELSFEWDVTKPTISITSPTNGSYCNASTNHCNAITVTGNCNEEGRTVTIGGGVADTATCSSGTWSKAIDYSILADQTFAITADINDAAGNNAVQASINVTKDTVAPSVNVGADVTTNTGVLINATANDANGVTFSWTKQSGAANIGFAPSATVEDVTVTSDTEETTVLRLTVTDPAGNSAYDELNFVWDLSDPTVSITTPAVSSYCNASNCASFTVGGNCSEEGRTVYVGGSASSTANCSSGNWSVAINYGALSEGALTITADLDDSAGNSATQATRSFTKDTTVPVVSVGSNIVTNTAYAVDAGVTDANAVTYLWSKTSGSGTITFAPANNVEDVTISSDTDATTVLRLTATDAAGNTAYDELNFTLDTTLPTVTITSPAVSSYCNASNCDTFTVAGNCSENGQTVTIGGDVATTTTCNSGNWSKSIDYSGLGDGARSITADIDDLAGNSATQATRSFTKDVVNPNVDVGLDILTNSAQLIDATASDTYGVASYQWSKASGPGTITFGSATAEDSTASSSAQGAHTIQLTVYDNAGNSASDTLVFTWDTVGPSVNVGADILTNSQVAIDATTSDINGIASYTWSKTAGSGNITFGTGSAEDTTAQANSDDLYTLQLTVVDNAGNSSNDTLYFTWDTTPPTVNVGGDVYTDAAHFKNATSSDTNGIASYAWSKVSGPGIVSFTASTSEDSTNSADTYGLYTVRLSATDNAGNTGSDDYILRWDYIPDTPTTLAGDPGVTNVNLTWASGGSEVGFIVVRKQGSAVSWTPSNGTSYTQGADLGTGHTLIYKGSALTFDDTGLTTDVTYHYAIWAYNTVDYYSTGSDTTSATTVDIRKIVTSYEGAASRYTACYVFLDGRVKCWGDATLGSTGQGDNVVRGDDAGEMGASLPALDLGTSTTAKDIAYSREHGCVITNLGDVKCWGRNGGGSAAGFYAGTLGYGDYIDRGDTAAEMGDNLPIVNIGSGVKAEEIFMATNATCIRTPEDKIKCWGNSFTGYGDTVQRGDDTADMGDNLPYISLGTGRTAKKLTQGSSAHHYCVVLDNDELKCWGSNNLGQLGYGDTSMRGDTTSEMGDGLPYVDLGAGVKSAVVSVGLNYTCAITTAGKVKCWGGNNFGKLGYGDTVDRGDGANEMGSFLPDVDLGAGKLAKDITTGSLHTTCALLTDNTLKCWGSANGGMSGYGDTFTRGDQAADMGDNLPTVNLGTGRSVYKLGENSSFACAILDNSDVKCWGINEDGNLGYGDIINRGNAANEMGDDLPAIVLE